MVQTAGIAAQTFALSIHLPQPGDVALPPCLLQRVPLLRSGRALQRPRTRHTLPRPTAPVFVPPLCPITGTSKVPLGGFRALQKRRAELPAPPLVAIRVRTACPTATSWYA